MAIRGSLDPFWVILDLALFYASFCPRLTTAQKGSFDTPQPSATTFENFHFWTILTQLWPTGFGGHPLDPKPVMRTKLQKQLGDPYPYPYPYPYPSGQQTFSGWSRQASKTRAARKICIHSTKLAAL